ncbi:MAG TPA: peptidoglycan DD-metalloendopeptidase family protein [Candidatus Paceibacterota bacterium]
MGGFIVNLSVNSGVESENAVFFGKKIVFGGPNLIAAAQGANPESEASSYIEEDYSSVSENASAKGLATIFSESAALESADNLVNAAPGRENLLVYKVQKGDTLTRIAANFGITTNTIIWANKEIASGFLRPGQEIVILPTSGIMHRVLEGETLNSIANFYGIAEEKILSANAAKFGPVQGGSSIYLKPGEMIVVPDARPRRNLALSESENLPDLKGYFAFPTAGWNWGELHPTNAVDIANSCGTPVFAAAEGLVIETGNPANWNGGNGGFVEIEHPNKTRTRYVHTQKNFVSVGDYIAKGEKISEMGSTGNVIGDTGCHLHFEVRGAKNPLAK